MFVSKTETTTSESNLTSLITNLTAFSNSVTFPIIYKMKRNFKYYNNSKWSEKIAKTGKSKVNKAKK